MVAITSRKDEDMIAAFQSIYKELKMYDYKPALQVLDNKCSHAIKAYIQSNNTVARLVQLHNHQVNTGEVTVKAVKYHTLSHLPTIDPDCPIQMRCKFVKRIQITLLILQMSRTDNKKSVYEALYHRNFILIKHLSPLGNKAISFIAPDGRKSWQPHAGNVWYIGLALGHYRLLDFQSTDRRHDAYGHVPDFSGTLPHTNDLQG